MNKYVFVVEKFDVFSGFFRLSTLAACVNLFGVDRWSSPFSFNERLKVWVHLFVIGGSLLVTVVALVRQQWFIRWHHLGWMEDETGKNSGILFRWASFSSFLMQ